MSTVDDFCQQYSLDDDAMQLLNEQSEELQEQIMQEFHPKDDTKNLSLLFQSFVKSRLKTKEGGKGKGKSGDRLHEIEEFVAHYGFDDESFRILQTMPNAVLDGIFNDFQIKDGVDSIDNLLQSFARSRLRLHQQERGGKGGGKGHDAGPDIKAIKKFSNMYKLSTESYHAMKELPNDLSEDIMRKFQIKDGVDDHNNLLQSYIKSRIKSYKGPMPTNRGAESRGRPEREAHTRERRPPTKKHHEEEDAVPMVDLSSTLGPMIQQFILKYKLNHESMNLLLGLPDEVCQMVLDEFKPREGTSGNINNLLGSFANSRLKGYEAGVASPPKRQKTNDAKHSAWHGELNGEVDEFVYQWNLNDDSRAALLKVRDHELLRNIMQTFKSKDGTSDLNNLLQAYVNSRLKRAGTEKYNQAPAAPQYHQHQAQVASANASQNLLARTSRKAKQISDFLKKHKLNSLNGKRMSVLEDHYADVLEILIHQYQYVDTSLPVNEEFYECWLNQVWKGMKKKFHMDDANYTKFAKMDWNIQIDVVKEFAPRTGAVDDINNMFGSFVASRIRNTLAERDTEHYESTPGPRKRGRDDDKGYSKRR